jgi:hypothetical protein
VRLVLLILAVAIGLGLLLGGSFKKLGELKLRYWGLAFVGYGLQIAPYPESWGRNIPVAFLLLSFVLLLFFALANLRQPGFWLIAVGLLMNFTVIAINWGMPVSRLALINSDQVEVLRDLRREEGQKHHLATEEDKLRFLGDVIPIPDPIHLVVSAGDLVLYLGAGILVAVRMRRVPARPGVVALAPPAAKTSGSEP